MSLRVVVEGDLYSIYWEHNQEWWKWNVDNLPGTSCTIEWCGGEPGWTPVATGYSILHPSDRFDKEKGRKISLARALKNWPREKRKLIWESYFNRKGAGDCQ